MTNENTNNEVDETVIPLIERSEFKLTEPIIATYTKIDSDGNKKTLNVSIEMGISIHNTEKGYEDLMTLMADKEDILRHRISTLLEQKSYDFMDSSEKRSVLSTEILDVVKTFYGSDYRDMIIEVYFGKFLTSVK